MAAAVGAQHNADAPAQDLPGGPEMPVPRRIGNPLHGGDSLAAALQRALVELRPAIRTDATQRLDSQSTESHPTLVQSIESDGVGPYGLGQRAPEG